MAIDKESTGMPEVDLTRRTTKVNLSMIVAIGVFYAIAFGVLLFLAARHPAANSGEADGTAPAARTAPGQASP